MRLPASPAGVSTIPFLTLCILIGALSPVKAPIGALASSPDSDLPGHHDLTARQNSKNPPPPLPTAVQLRNNEPYIVSIEQNSTAWYAFPKDQVQGKHGKAGPGLPSELPGIDTPPAEGSHARELKRRGESAGNEDILGELSSRQTDTATRTVFLTANTCRQPLPKDLSNAPSPQLTLYVSTDARNKRPGPDVDESLKLLQQEIGFDGGFANYTLETDTDVFFGVYGPTLRKLPLAGDWEVQVAASIDALYHNHISQSPFLFLVDSDTTSALLVTDNLTQARADDPLYKQWMEISPPFSMFAVNLNDSQTQGVQHSYCGLLNANQIAGIDVQSSMITRGLGNKPKEQFHITGLNGSSTYYGVLAMSGNSTATGGIGISGGGQVWNAMNFTTKADNNCEVIFDLPFCSEVAYAVPSNPQLFDTSKKLATVYDNNARKLYKNFTYSLQQVACNTTSEAQYSLARNCDDCAHDYKNWLCAVSVPRCEDFSATEPWLQPRNVGASFANGTRVDFNKLDGPGLPGADGADSLVGMPGQGQALLTRMYANSSRNPLIDQTIRPGPYKEVLPCEDLCYSLMQSCPASLGFNCPLSHKGLERSYGRRTSDGRVTCSYLGAVYYLNGAGTLLPSFSRASAFALAGMVGFWMVL